MSCSECEMNSILISRSAFVSLQHRSHAFLRHFNNGNGVPTRSPLKWSLLDGAITRTTTILTLVLFSDPSIDFEFRMSAVEVTFCWESSEIVRAASIWWAFASLVARRVFLCHNILCMFITANKFSSSSSRKCVIWMAGEQNRRRLAKRTCVIPALCCNFCVCIR